jgi:DNA-binding PadR family transcriptional regulator
VVVLRELNAFRRDLLATTAIYEPDSSRHEYPYGGGLKQALQTLYGREVNNGQLYPGLRDLVDHGLLTRRIKNQRTHYYEFTDRGRAALTGHAYYLTTAAALAGGDVPWLAASVTPGEPLPAPDEQALPPAALDQDNEEDGARP